MLPTPGFAQLRSPGFKWTGISPYFCFSLSLPLRPIDHSLSPSEFFSGWSPRSLCLKSDLRYFLWLDKESKVGKRERERVRWSGGVRIFVGITVYLHRACLPAVPLDERKCYPVVTKGPSTIFTRLSVQDLEGIVATSAMSMVML